MGQRRLDVRVEDQGVGVRVGVDEPREHEQAVGVDHVGAVDGQVGADLPDAVAVHPDVRPDAVGQQTTSDQHR